MQGTETGDGGEEGEVGFAKNMVNEKILSKMTRNVGRKLFVLRTSRRGRLGKRYNRLHQTIRENQKVLHKLFATRGRKVAQNKFFPALAKQARVARTKKYYTSVQKHPIPEFRKPRKNRMEYNAM